MSTILEAVGLKKRYAPQPGQREGQLAVKGLDLRLERGEIFSLLGPNGAGKTTSINMMCGLIAPTEGDVRINGKSILQEPRTVKRMIGVVPQEIALYPQLSARANLEFFGQMYGLSGAALAARCEEVLEFIGLKERQNERIDTYSGGMKRRVNIGVGLLHKPEIVFMDEPTVGIDPQSRRSILDAVKNLNAQGMTVLYTTHYMEEAQELSDRVGIFDHGELIALGRQYELMAKVGEADTLLIKIGEAAEQAASICKSLSEVQSVSIEGETLRVLASRGRHVLPAIIKALDEVHITLQSVEIREPNLESVFLQMTGRALRD
jgi:ABC-2 type transport system ATP-binding protein